VVTFFTSGVSLGPFDLERPNLHDNPPREEARFGGLTVALPFVAMFWAERTKVTVNIVEAHDSTSPLITVNRSYIIIYCKIGLRQRIPDSHSQIVVSVASLAELPMSSVLYPQLT